MSRSTRVRQRRLVLAALAAVAATTSCRDVTGPPGGSGPGWDAPPPPPPAPAVVPIVPTGTSTTGIPVLPLPALGGSPMIEKINASNWVAGTHLGTRRAVLWRGGPAFEELPQPLGADPQDTFASGLNDDGMVVGVWGGRPSRAYRWSDATGSVFLPDPPALASGTAGNAEAAEVDAAGNILVRYNRDTSPSSCDPAGNVTGSSALLSPPHTDANYVLVGGCQFRVHGNAIDGGVVVGIHQTDPVNGGPQEGFRWDPTGMQLLGGWIPVALSGSNIAAQLLGAPASTAGRAVYPGNFEPLGTLPGGTASTASGVNGLGWVVGSANTNATGVLETHAFLWTPADGMIDLGTLGGSFSRAADVNDHGYIVGEARNAAGQLLPVIWFVDPATPDQPPEIQTILSQTVTVGETLVVTPVVSDPEDDPFSLSWEGVPDGASVNGSLTWAPTADDVGETWEVTVTATQDGAPTLSDSETFAVSVLAAPVPSANLSVVVGPITPQQQFISDLVAYRASLHNAGPDAATARLEVALQYRQQAEWGDTPPEAAVNDIFFIDVEIAADQTVHLPFEVTYHAFGVQAVTATVSGAHDEVDPGDDEHVYEQVIDLALSTLGVQSGGLDIPGAHTTDGLGLAVAGVRVPSTLIAGDPGFDLFLPADLTPGGLLTGGQSVLGAAFEAGGQFVPSPGTFLPGALAQTAGAAGSFVIPVPAHWVDGRVHIPAVNAWDPAGRLFFERGSTNLRVNDRAGTTMSLEKGGGPGIKVNMSGGSSDARLGLCTNAFQAQLGDGDGAEFACGSLTTTVLTGEVSVVLADGTRVDVAAGAEVRVTEDGQGGFDVEILQGSEEDVTVTPPAGNGAPQAAPAGPYVAAVGQPLTLDGTGSSDPEDDPLTYHWLLDDSSAAGTTATGATPTIGAPATSGLYLLTLTVSDPGGASSSASTEVAVYDPNGSSVTGGGWFDSRAGALTADPSAEGKANFAFHVAYRRGRSTPDGHARLAFKAGDLNLASEAFEWLVVGGTMARFRGTGVLEGRAGTVTFEVVVRDPDRIQVRIWDAAGTIYDSTEVGIGGGRIVIQG